MSIHRNQRYIRENTCKRVGEGGGGTPKGEEGEGTCTPGATIPSFSVSFILRGVCFSKKDERAESFPLRPHPFKKELFRTEVVVVVLLGENMVPPSALSLPFSVSSPRFSCAGNGKMKYHKLSVIHSLLPACASPPPTCCGGSGGGGWRRSPAPSRRSTAQHVIHTPVHPHHLPRRRRRCGRREDAPEKEKK